MNYYLMNKKFEFVTLIETYESFIWTNRFYEPGDFELFIPATEANMKLYSTAANEHYYIVRDDDDPYNCRAMMVNNVSLVTNYDQGNHISVTGTCLKGLLSQRIVWGKCNLAGNFETEIRRLVTEQAISPDNPARSFPDLILGDIAGVTETINSHLEGTNLASAIEEACKTKKLGWDIRMNIPGKKLIFTIVAGADRSYRQHETELSKRNPYVVFSPEFDNLLGTTYEVDYNEFKNIALIGGEMTETNERTGEQTRRDVSQVAVPYKHSTRTPSAYERYEIYVDGNDISDTEDAEYYAGAVSSAMINKGQETLEDYKKTIEVTGDVVPNYTFNIYVDYFIGDLVSIKNEYNQEFVARVIEVVEVEEMKKKSITPKFFIEWYEGKEDPLNPVKEEDMRIVPQKTSDGDDIYRITTTGEVRVRGAGRKHRDRVCLVDGVEVARTNRAISALNKVYPDEV